MKQFFTEDAIAKLKFHFTYWNNIQAYNYTDIVR